MIIAVDFDGTIQDSNKEPNMILINRLINYQRHGASIILWTCREGKRLQEAVLYCMRLGLKFNAINQNVPEGIKRLGNDSRKIFADVYIDDKAVKS